MRQDILKFTYILSAAALLGLSSGYFFEILSVVSLALIAWQVYRLNQLYCWVLNPNLDPFPEQSGQVFDLHKELHHRFKKTRHHKRQISKQISQLRRAASVMPDAIVLIDERGKIDWANNNAFRLLNIEWPRDANNRFSNLVRDPEVLRLLQNPAGVDQGIQVSLPNRPNETLSLKCVRYTRRLRMVIARDVSRMLTVNKLQADFVANVSHELKTPLTVLRGYLEIMQDHPKLDVSLQKPVTQMANQSERMQLIVDDLLYLARVEHKGNQTSHTPIEVSPLATSIVESFHTTIEEKNIKIELKIDCNIDIKGNRSELFSAFSNLLSNAIKYTKESDSRISIGWESGQRGAIFSVKDNGPGIPGPAIPNLTKRFFRVDENRSREEGGTGLGLAIVKHVLQRHHAALEIDSVIGVGSEFRCIFPATTIIRKADQEA
jgi:two-component system phosphate regulon sensor histidine kinase PhoR